MFENCGLKYMRYDNCIGRYKVLVQFSLLDFFEKHHGSVILHTLILQIQAKYQRKLDIECNYTHQRTSDLGRMYGLMMLR